MTVLPGPAAMGAVQEVALSNQSDEGTVKEVTLLRPGAKRFVQDAFFLEVALDGRLQTPR